MSEWWSVACASCCPCPSSWCGSAVVVWLWHGLFFCVLTGSDSAHTSHLVPSSCASRWARGRDGWTDAAESAVLVLPIVSLADQISRGGPRRVHTACKEFAVETANNKHGRWWCSTVRDQESSSPSCTELQTVLANCMQPPC